MNVIVCSDFGDSARQGSISSAWCQSFSTPFAPRLLWPMTFQIELSDPPHPGLNVAYALPAIEPEPQGPKRRFHASRDSNQFVESEGGKNRRAPASKV